VQSMTSLRALIALLGLALMISVGGAVSMHEQDDGEATALKATDAAYYETYLNAVVYDEDGGELYFGVIDMCQPIFTYLIDERMISCNWGPADDSDTMVWDAADGWLNISIMSNGNDLGNFNATCTCPGLPEFWMSQNLLSNLGWGGGHKDQNQTHLALAGMCDTIYQVLPALRTPSQ